MPVAKPPGQRRGNPRGPEPSLPTSEPLGIAAPPDLGPDGQAIWSSVVNQATWLQHTDLNTLRLLADGADRRAILMADLEERGPVVEAKQGPLPNPALSALATLEKQMTQWLSLLGLTPSDRGRLGIQAAKAESTLARLRASRTAQEPRNVSET